MGNNKIEIPPIYYNNWNPIKDSYFINKNDSIYIIHTIGKVASKSIFEALKNNLDTPIYHLHYLSSKLLDDMFNWFVINTTYKSNHAEIIDGRNFKHIYEKNKSNIKLKIITLIREPVSWQISMLTEIAQITYPEIVHKNKFNYSQFNKILNKSLINSPDSPILNLNFYLNWWNTEFASIFKYNILGMDFKPEKGWAIYEVKNISTLIIQYEQLNQVYKKAFKEFGLSDEIVLPQINKMTDKDLGDFDPVILKRKIKINKKVLSKIYKSNIITHFYNKNQIENYYANWTLQNRNILFGLSRLIK